MKHLSTGKYKVLLAGCCLLLLLIFPGISKADVIIKVVVENPSDTEAQEVPVKYAFPEEISAENIKDTGGLKFMYDVKGGTFAINDVINLEPGEKKVLKLTIEDIWNIKQEDVDELWSLLQQSVDSAKGEEPERLASIEQVAEKIGAKIEKLVEGQEELQSDIDKRIQRYNSDQETIKKLREEIYAIEMHARHQEEEAKKEEKKEDPTTKIIKLVVEAENPTPQELTMPFKYYLPADVKPEYINDFKGFDFRYDTKKRMSYLVKTETFTPQEKKKFILEINNVWNIPESDIRAITQEAKRAVNSYRKSRFQELAASLYNKIVREADNLIATQNIALSEDVANIIYTFKENKKRYQQLRTDLLKLQSMAIQDAEKKHNVLRDIELPKDLHQLSDVLLKRVFKEGKISLYKMIMGTIVFLAIVTFVASAVWLKDFYSDSNKQFQNVRSEEKVKG